MPDPALPTLPERRSLNGQHDAYCRVCWEPVYAVWIGGDHEGACIRGATVATDCPDAMARARETAFIAKLRREGVIR